jgi:hypothetical protein
MTDAATAAADATADKIEAMMNPKIKTKEKTDR